MLKIGRDIHSLAHFKRRTSELVEQLYLTERAIVLTVNGRPKLIVQEREADEKILARPRTLEEASGDFEPRYGFRGRP
jgi:hypothetical protein